MVFHHNFSKAYKSIASIKASAFNLVLRYRHLVELTSPFENGSNRITF